MTTTIRRVFEAGQQLMLDRLDLIRWDATDAVSRSARGTALLLMGGLLLGGALFLLLAACTVLLDRALPLPVAIMTTAAAIGALGLAAMLVGMHRTHTEQHFSITSDLVGNGRSGGVEPP